MTEPTDILVCRAVAEHLGLRPNEIRTTDRTLDLGLQPLDLVIIGLAIEDHAGLAFPFEGLEQVHAVAQLADLARRMHVAKRHREQPGIVAFPRPGTIAKRRKWLRRMVA